MAKGCAVGHHTGPAQDQSAPRSPSRADEGPDAAAIVRVRIDELLDADSPRLGGLDEAHARALAEVQGHLPPIIVHRPSMRIIDGMHRRTAARISGRDEIDAVFFHGSRDDAFRLGVGANIRHGLPLSLADRRAAAARILRSHPHLSDRAIALTAGLAPRTVASIRASSAKETGAVARTGQDGRVRPLNSIEGRLRAARTIAARPGATLREIARGAGVAVSTVRDVRIRVLAGQDPIPDRLRASAVKTQGNRSRSSSSGNVTEATDPDRILEALRRDPTLRYSDSGRALLRWMGSRTVQMDQWYQNADAIPSHCLEHVASFARACAQTWLKVAEAIDSAATRP